MKIDGLNIDFFLIGAARCGTTSLYNHLNTCEGVFLPNVKEPNFFSDVDSPNAEDFKDPLQGQKYHAKIITCENVYKSLYKSAQKHQIKGDSSPSYIWDKNVAKKLYAHNPEAKIIASLRHPVDRAYSHYIMNYYTGVDKSKSFEKALNAKKNPIWGSCNHYLEMGAYYQQLKAYYDVFPKSQIKVLVYENWTKNIEESIKEVFKFLETSENNRDSQVEIERNKIQPMKGLFLLNLLRQNKVKLLIKRIISQDRLDKLKMLLFSKSKPIPKMDASIRTQLIKDFEDDIEQLSQLTGIDLKKIWLS